MVLRLNWIHDLPFIYSVFSVNLLPGVKCAGMQHQTSNFKFRSTLSFNNIHSVHNSSCKFKARATLFSPLQIYFSIFRIPFYRSFWKKNLWKQNFEKMVITQRLIWSLRVIDKGRDKCAANNDVTCISSSFKIERRVTSWRLVPKIRFLQITRFLCVKSKKLLELKRLSIMCSISMPNFSNVAAD